MTIIHYETQAKDFVCKWRRGQMRGELTSGPVMRRMLLFAVPMILGNLLQQCYNVADTLIVGRVLGGKRAGGSGLRPSP